VIHHPWRPTHLVLQFGTINPHSAQRNRAESGETMDTLRALDTFKRIAEVGSFSAVAREINSSQSAVTRVIDGLEAHFGLRLFHRTTRHLSLTDDGEDLLGYARRLLDTAEDMEGALGRHRSTPTGLVRVGVTAACSVLLVPRLGALFEQYPGLSVDLVVGTSFTDLVRERLDIAVQLGPPSDMSMVARVVGAVGRVLVAAPAYLKRCGLPAHPAELSDHACVVYETGPDAARWRFNGPEGPIEVAVSGAIRTNYIGAALRAALAGYGIAYLPELVAFHDIHAGNLCRLLDAFTSDRTEVYVVYPSHRHLAPRTRVMIDFLVEQLKRSTSRFDGSQPRRTVSDLVE
jgi:DNA-binding transcriptional LysR family regulator